MSVLLTASLSAALPLSAASHVDVVKMRTENRVNPLGIGTSTPRFSWQITSDRKGVVQTSYQILVASSREKLDRNEADLWDSGERNSDEQLWIPYQGKALLSGAQAYWKVRITTNKGKSEWTEPQLFTIGLLGETKWSGTWIGLEDLQPGEQKGMHTRLAARYIRKDFAAKGKVKRAVAYVAGLGVYEFYVNGQRMGGSQALQPAPTDYRKTIYYNTFDVTSLLTEKNAIAIKLGNGRMFLMRQEKAYKTPVMTASVGPMRDVTGIGTGSVIHHRATSTMIASSLWPGMVNASIGVRNTRMARSGPPNRPMVRRLRSKACSAFLTARASLLILSKEIRLLLCLSILRQSEQT